MQCSVCHHTLNPDLSDVALGEVKCWNCGNRTDLDEVSAVLAAALNGLIQEVNHLQMKIKHLEEGTEP